MNNVDEQCFRVYIRDDFQSTLIQIRTELGIPTDGFNSEESYIEWYSHFPRKLKHTFYQYCEELVKKYQLPPDAQIRLKEYFLFGTSGLRPESLDIWMPLDEMGSCSIQISEEDAGQWEKSGIPFARIIISDNAGLNDTIKYIRSHWKAIQRWMDIQRDGKPKRRIRPIKDRKLKERVLTLNRFQFRELKEIAPQKEYGGYLYKEDAIAAIIYKEFKKRVETENIKKITSRRKGH